jgi:hypothetical protein
MFKSIFIAQGSSVSAGFSLTNWILQQNLSRESAHIIESSILPQGGFLILVEGVGSALQSLHDHANAEHRLATFKTLLIDELHADVLPAFYSLQNDVQRGDAILICECVSIIEAIVIANEAARFSSSIRVLDIRTGRGTGGIPLTFVMGPAPALVSWETEMDTRRLGDAHRRVLIDHPHPEFTELFV